MVEAWQPATELEGRMGDALGSGDQESYFRLLAHTELIIPVPPEIVEDVLAGRAQPAWPTQVIDDRTHVAAFTSPEAMRACVGAGVQHFMRLKFGEIASSWPHPQWWLAVNTGLPIQAVLPSWFVKQIADGDARPPLAGQPASAAPTMTADADPGQSADAAADGQMPSDQNPAGHNPLGQSATAETGAGRSSVGQSGIDQDILGQSPNGQNPAGHDGTRENTAGRTGDPTTDGRARGADDWAAVGIAAGHPAGAPPLEQAVAPTPAPTSGGPEATPEGTDPSDPSDLPPAVAETSDDAGPAADRPPAADLTPADGGTLGGPLQPAADLNRPEPHSPAGDAPSAADAFAGAAPAAGDVPSTGDLPPAGPGPGARAPLPGEGLTVGANARGAAGLPPLEEFRPAIDAPMAEVLRGRRHKPQTDDFKPANDVERELLRAGMNGDQESFVNALLGAEVLILVPEHTDPTRRPGRPGFPWLTAEVRGETSIALFTSPERMLEVLGEVPGPGSTGSTDFMKFPFASIIRYWPDRRWALAVNSGTKVGASLDGERLLGLARWADQVAAQRMAANFQPQNEVEKHLFDAVIRQDTEAFFDVLGTAQVLMPADPETPWGIEPGQPGFPWRPVQVQGQNSIQMFTSLKWMHDAIGPSRYIMPSFADIASAWPDSGWTLVLNPGAPIDATVVGEHVPVLRPELAAEPATPPPGPHPETAGESQPVPGTTAIPERTAVPEPARQDESGPRGLPEFEPGNRTDQELHEAALNGDTDAFLRVLLGAEVLVPIPSDAPPDATPMDPRFRWEGALRDPSSVQVFTSRVQLHGALAGSAGADPMAAEPRFVYVDYRDLIGCWPHAEWAMLINPGTRIGASLRGDQVQALSDWVLRVGLVLRDRETSPREEPSRTEAPAPGAGPMSAPVIERPQQPPVMQKVLPHGHVPWYLDQGYDRLGGFVHRAADVADLQTPAQLYEALGLLYADSPFAPDDEGVYVVRWPAHCPDLYRIPFGGRSDEELEVWGEAGWVVERPPFHGDGFAPGSAGTIREYKVDSVRLPYGAEIYHLGRDRSERFVAVYDPDVLGWLRPEEDTEADQGERTEAVQ